MCRSDGQSEARHPVFKYPSKHGTHLSTHCRSRRREDYNIVRNVRVQPPASLATIQAQVAPSLVAPVSSRTIRRHLAEKHLGSRCPLHVLPLTPTHRRLR
ncbi:transposable element Tcb2 transposase [Trichonephila clavipes]|nr:transposable element Tcb2 transposase [Trichonephila clavipes]